VEVTAKAYEEAYGDQQDMPAEQPVGQGKAQLIQEEHSAHQQEE
jgi:hypothetical protein